MAEKVKHSPTDEGGGMPEQILCGNIIANFCPPSSSKAPIVSSPNKRQESYMEAPSKK